MTFSLNLLFLSLLHDFNISESLSVLVSSRYAEFLWGLGLWVFSLSNRGPWQRETFLHCCWGDGLGLRLFREELYDKQITYWTREVKTQIWRWLTHDWVTENLLDLKLLRDSEGSEGRWWDLCFAFKCYWINLDGINFCHYSLVHRQCLKTERNRRKQL